MDHFSQPDKEYHDFWPSFRYPDWIAFLNRVDNIIGSVVMFRIGVIRLGKGSWIAAKFLLLDGSVLFPVQRLAGNNYNQQ